MTRFRGQAVGTPLVFPLELASHLPCLLAPRFIFNLLRLAEKFSAVNCSMKLPTLLKWKCCQMPPLYCTVPRRCYNRHRHGRRFAVNINDEQLHPFPIEWKSLTPSGRETVPFSSFSLVSAPHNRIIKIIICTFLFKMSAPFQGEIQYIKLCGSILRNGYSKVKYRKS